MAVRIYIGNMSFGTTEETLSSTFSRYGKVLSSEVIKDRVTNQSKGFGFVEMETEEDAKKAIAGLNGKDLEGRRLRVNFAEEKAPRNNLASQYRKKY